jgi:GNAT superfamily N-acetyltransferase
MTQGRIRPAQPTDISALVDLSEQKRLQYQQYQPIFWRKAEDSRTKQHVYLEHLLAQENTLILLHEDGSSIDGFVIASIVKAPPVYNPQGLVCTIDDYCVAEGDLWQGVGQSLLNVVKQEAKQRNCVLVVVVCGHQDTPKRNMLISSGFTIASEWYVQEL